MLQKKLIKLGEWGRLFCHLLFTFFLLFAESFEPCKFILVNNFKIKIKNNSIPKTVNMKMFKNIIFWTQDIGKYLLILNMCEF